MKKTKGYGPLRVQKKTFPKREAQRNSIVTTPSASGKEP